MRPLSDTRIRILKRLARNLTEAQRRALSWMAGGSDGTARSWVFSVDPKTHSALARKRLITEAPGRVDITILGRSALAEAEKAE